MKKQIVLDEQDIKEFHEDAEHLRWIYKRMIYEHGENANFDYMHRFAKIFNKLKQLQRMKIRLAKKIMKQARHLSTASDYWYRRLRDFEYKICYGFVGKKDHRITKAISLTSKKKKNENKRY